MADHTFSTQTDTKGRRKESDSIPLPISHALTTMATRQVTTDPSVFISYSSKDRERVLPFADHLEVAGIRVWLDRQRIGGGMRWAEEIVRGIKASRTLMLMCSDNAMRSRAVKQEIQLAWKYELSFLPLLLERTHFPEQLEFFLEGCQWIELMDKPPEQWLDSVLQSLARIADCTGTSGAPPAASGIQPIQLPPGLDGLLAVAKFTDRIWPLVVEDRDHCSGRISYQVRDLGAAREGVQHRLRLGSSVFWAIECDQDAHLLLIDEGPEGKTYCLCPSWFVPNTPLKRGLNLLPPPSAGCEPFVLTGVPGRERLLAILSDQPLCLDWMPPNSRVPARVLSEADINYLIDLLQRLEPSSWSALSTFCDVVL